MPPLRLEAGYANHEIFAGGKIQQAGGCKLVSLLQAELDADDAASIPALVKNVVVETGYSKRAAERLRMLLTKLGKPTSYGSDKSQTPTPDLALRQRAG